MREAPSPAYEPKTYRVWYEVVPVALSYNSLDVIGSQHSDQYAAHFFVSAVIGDWARRREQALSALSSQSGAAAELRNRTSRMGCTVNYSHAAAPGVLSFEIEKFVPNPRIGMRRREFITLLGTAATWPFAARAQQADRMRRIGMLEVTAPASNAANFDALRKGLREEN